LDVVLSGEKPDYLALLEQELSDVLGGKAPSYEDLNRLPILKAIVSETFRYIAYLAVCVKVLVQMWSVVIPSQLKPSLL